MDGWGAYRELASTSRFSGAFSFILALLVTTFLERIQWKLHAGERAHWWASNGRDLINAFSVACMAAGLYTLGFTAPIAVTVAATLVVLMTASQSVLAARDPRGGWSLAIAAVLGSPFLLAPRWMAEAVHGLLRGLFP